MERHQGGDREEDAEAAECLHTRHSKEVSPVEFMLRKLNFGDYQSFQAIEMNKSLNQLMGQQKIKMRKKNVALEELGQLYR